jgi:hypothetical protein
LTDIPLSLHAAISEYLSTIEGCELEDTRCVSWKPSRVIDWKTTSVVDWKPSSVVDWKPSRVVDLLLTKNIYKEAASLEILRVMSLKNIDGCRL